MSAAQVPPYPDSAPPAGALHGITVLDLSRVVAGPLAASLLGDLGANVIKVEGPQNPDEARGWHPPEVYGTSVYFATVNRSKRAITVDLKTEAGQRIIRDLVRQSDVVLENFTTGTLDRFGLGYADLAEINPGVVLCSITGFGQSGPYRHLPGYDFLAQGMSGFMSMSGEPEAGPIKAPIALSDMITGLHAVISVLAAIQARTHTGRGQHCDLSLLDSTVFSLLNLATTYLNTGVIPRRYGNQHQAVVPYQSFETRDQPVIVAVGNDAQFARLCAMLGLEELAQDARYATVSQRIIHRETLIPRLEEAFLGVDSERAIRELRERNVPCGPINTLDRVFADPHVIARQGVVEVEHPTAGRLRLVAAPFGLQGTPAVISAAPPTFSEHTDEVLRELGYAADRIEELREAGVIAPKQL